jgi:hypothetical protein
MKKKNTPCPSCHGLDDDMCDCDVCGGTGFVLDHQSSLTYFGNGQDGTVFINKTGYYQLGNQKNYVQILRDKMIISEHPLKTLLKQLLP